MRKIEIELPDYVDDGVFDDIWNDLIGTLNKYVNKWDWNIEEVDE